MPSLLWSFQYLPVIIIWSTVSGVPLLMVVGFCKRAELKCVAVDALNSLSLPLHQLKVFFLSVYAVHEAQASIKVRTNSHRTLGLAGCSYVADIMLTSALKRWCLTSKLYVMFTLTHTFYTERCCFDDVQFFFVGWNNAHLWLFSANSKQKTKKQTQAFSVSVMLRGCIVVSFRMIPIVFITQQSPTFTPQCSGLGFPLLSLKSFIININSTLLSFSCLKV